MVGRDCSSPTDRYRSPLLRATLLVTDTPRFIRHRWGDIKEVGINNPQQNVARIVRRVGVEGLRLRVRQCVRVSVGASKGEVVSSVSSKGASSSSTSIRDCEAESVRWMEASSCRRPVAVGAAGASSKE